MAPVVKCATALKRAVLISVADLEGERPPGQSTILIRSWEEADLKIWPAALAVLVGQHRLAKRHAVFSVLRSAEQTRQITFPVAFPNIQRVGEADELAIIFVKIHRFNSI